MAAIVRSATAQRPAMPPGYEETAAGVTHTGGVALEAGDIVYLDGANGWKVATAALCRANQCGFAAQDYAATERGISILLRGEIDNYADDLTPGQPLFAGGTAGDLDDTADLTDTPKIWAATATRIRFTF